MPISARTSTTSSRRPSSRSVSFATATSAGRRGRAGRARRCRVDPAFRRGSCRCRAVFAEPLALRYHGHQFRVYNPQLGDGRGFLFAQLHDLVDGRLLDLGTKGSGRTPWSRGADGRLTLKGGVRELLASSMLEALGVDTSKTFSLIETGEELARNDEPSPTRLRCWSGSAIRTSGSAASSASPTTRIGRAGADCSTMRWRPTFPRPGGRTRRRARWRSWSGSARWWRGPGRSGWPPASSTAYSTPTTSTSPARASTTAPGASCRPTIRVSPLPTSTRAGSTPSADSRRRCCGISPGLPSACSLLRHRQSWRRR